MQTLRLPVGQSIVTITVEDSNPLQSQLEAALARIRELERGVPPAPTIPDADERAAKAAWNEQVKNAGWKIPGNEAEWWSDARRFGLTFEKACEYSGFAQSEKQQIAAKLKERGLLGG